MLERYITPELIQLNVTAADWEEAVDIAAQPLVANGLIDLGYVAAIKDNHRAMPYMVIAPGIMLAHARPECGAHGLGISLTTLAEAVEFGSELNDPVRFIITLATTDEHSHLALLEALTEFLMSDDLTKLYAAQSVAEVMNILKGDF